MTGGAGFIGSNLVRQLVADGNDVTVLDNLLSGFRSNLDPFPQVRFIEGDIRDDAVVAEAIKGADVVFHLAASVGNKRSIDYPLVDAEINVMGTLTVLEAARHAGVQKDRRVLIGRDFWRTQDASHQGRPPGRPGYPVWQLEALHGKGVPGICKTL